MLIQADASQQRREASLGFRCYLLAFFVLELVEASGLPGPHIEGFDSLKAIRSDTGAGNEWLSEGPEVAQYGLTSVCNILTLHNH